LANGYFLVHIVQTGTDGADQVWRAPVWLTPEANDPHPVDPGETSAPPQPHGEDFVSSVNSSVFHIAMCRVVAQIGAEPPDRTQAVNRSAALDGLPQ
jgi:hypothetical protein